MAKISKKPIKKTAKAVAPKIEEVKGEETIITPTIAEEPVSIVSIIMEKVRKVCENNKME